MRLTHSRDGYHADPDLLDILSATAGVVASLPVSLSVVYFLMGHSGSLGTILLIVLSVGAITIRATVNLVNRTIRHRIFDGEQRRCEIVPHHHEEREVHDA